MKWYNPHCSAKWMRHANALTAVGGWKQIGEFAVSMIPKQGVHVMNARPQHPFTSALALVTAAIGWEPSGVFLQPYGSLLLTGDAPGEHDYGAPLGAMVRDADPDSASAQLSVRLTRKRDDGTWEHVWVVSGVGDWRGGTNEAAWVAVDVLRRIVGAQRTTR